MKRNANHSSWKKIASALFLAIIAAGLVWLLPQFRLDEIAVEGQDSLAEDQIIQASGLEKGQHLFSGIGGSLEHWPELRYARVEQEILESFPVIETATAALSFPGAIKISIVERIEIAYISIPDGCAIIDKNAVVMRIDKKPPDLIPLIDGITVCSLVPGKKLSADVPEALNSAITIMGAIIDADKDARADIKLLSLVKSIRPLSGRKIYLSIAMPGSGRELVVLAETGQEQLDDMIWLRLALEQGALENLGRGILDLTGGRRTFTPE